MLESINFNVQFYDIVVIGKSKLLFDFENPVRMGVFMYDLSYVFVQLFEYHQKDLLKTLQYCRDWPTVF